MTASVKRRGKPRSNGVRLSLKHSPQYDIQRDRTADWPGRRTTRLTERSEFLAFNDASRQLQNEKLRMQRITPLLAEYVGELVAFVPGGTILVSAEGMPNPNKVTWGILRAPNARERQLKAVAVVEVRVSDHSNCVTRQLITDDLQNRKIDVPTAKEREGMGAIAMQGSPRGRQPVLIAWND